MSKDEAIKYFETDPQKRDGVFNLASLLKVRTQVVYQWKKIPGLRQLELYKLTDGALNVDAEYQHLLLTDKTA